MRLLKQSEDGIYNWPEVDDFAWVGAADIIGLMDLNRVRNRTLNLPFFALFVS